MDYDFEGIQFRYQLSPPLDWRVLSLEVSQSGGRVSCASLTLPAIAHSSLPGVSLPAGTASTAYGLPSGR